MTVRRRKRILWILADVSFVRNLMQRRELPITRLGANIIANKGSKREDETIEAS